MSVNDWGGLNKTTSPLSILSYIRGNFSTSSTSPFNKVGSILALGIAYSDTTFLPMRATGIGDMASIKASTYATTSPLKAVVIRGTADPGLNLVRTLDESRLASISTGQS
mmetsp:Transcript_32879/g.38283  ORF Transcript_32879/g.38283 Transcript_32879/m.38283 type:complete len:110 (+) Transcript_32879:786-1115(+)